MTRAPLRPAPRHAMIALLAAVSLAPSCKPKNSATGGSYWGGATSQGADPLGGLDCDPIQPTQCGFPFPSNVYLIADTTTVTGWHVQFRKETLPIPVTSQAATDPTPWTYSDGFSPGSAILVHMPGVDVPGMWKAGTLASPETIAVSMSSSSPTVIIEADTGAWVPHWTEIDASASDGSPLTDRALLIRPAIRLKDNTRYIVAIRSLVDTTNTPLKPTSTFQALRDGSGPQSVTITPHLPGGAGATRTVNDPTVEPRRGLYADIFSKLSSAKVEQSTLQLAWDFTTASRESNTRDLISMRDGALATVGAQGPTYTITNVQSCPDDCPDPPPSATSPPSPIWSRIVGYMTVPNYLNQAPDPTPQPISGYPNMTTVPGMVVETETTRLNRDPKTRLPVQNGTENWPFVISIPTSVYNSVSAGGPGAPVVQQGHGLFGNAAEGEGYGGEFDRLANEKGYVTVAVNFQGFTNNDPNIAIEALGGNIEGFLGLVEPQHQGTINQLLVMRMMIGGFAADKTVSWFNGHPAIDPTRRYYRGDSQGGIMGTTYMSISTDVTRGYLGEPGLPYNILLPRSIDWGPYDTLLIGSYPQYGGRDIQLILGMVQMLWDRTDPDGYAPYMTTNMLPNTPSHTVLLNVAIGDQQVTPYGAHILARTIGAQNLKPVNREIYGIPDADGPLSGNTMIEFDFHLDQNPAVTLEVTDVPNLGPDNCDPHDKVRQAYTVFSQTDLFFSTGTVGNFCQGDSLLPPSTNESCTADSDCANEPSDANGQSRQGEICSPTSHTCVEPIWSCDFDYATGHNPPTPMTPTACSPG